MYSNHSAERFSKLTRTYNEAALVQERVAGELAEMICEANSEQKRELIFERVFEFGVGTGFLTHRLLAQTKIRTYFINDVSRIMIDRTVSGIETSDRPAIIELVGDAETLTWPTNTDLVASASVVQWFSDPLSAVGKAFQSLKKNGLFALATYLPGTHREIFHLTGIGLTYPDEAAWKNAFREFGRFNILNWKTVSLELHFASPRDVLRHIDRTGVNLTRTGFAWTTKRLKNFETEYEKLFSTPEGCVTLHYEALLAVARKLI